MTRLVVVLAVAAAMAGCKRTEKKAAGEAAAVVVPEGGPPYPEVVPDKVSRLIIEPPDGARVVIERADSGWQLRQPIADRADQRAVTFAVDELRKLVWDDEPLAKNKADWASHGADPAQMVTIRVTHDGAELPPLHLSKKRGVARVGNSHHVLRVHHTSYFTFVRDLKLWRDRTVSRVDPDEVTALELVGADGASLVLTRSGGGPPDPATKTRPPDRWSASGTEVDDDRVNQLFRGLLDLEASELSDAAELPGPRRLALRIRTESGNREIRVGADAQGGGLHVAVDGDGGPRVMILRGPVAELLRGAPGNLTR